MRHSIVASCQWICEFYDDRVTSTLRVRNLSELSAPGTTTRTRGPSNVSFKSARGVGSCRPRGSTILSMLLHPRFLPLPWHEYCSDIHPCSEFSYRSRKSDVFLKPIGNHWPGWDYVAEEWVKTLTCYRRILSKVQTS